MAKQYGNFTDFISVARASSGTCLRKVKFGPDLVENGSFRQSVDGWTCADGTIAPVGGQMEITYVSSTQWTYASVPTKAGKVYRYTAYARSENAVNWRIQAEDGTFGGTVLGQTTEIVLTSELVMMTFNFVAQSDTTVLEVFTRLTSGTAYVDNVTVEECQLDHKDGELILFNHPENVARVEYDEYGRVIGTLIEESRTNLLPYSEDFTNTAWAHETIDMTLAGAYALGADGNQTASRLQYGGGGDLNDYIQDRSTPSGGTASKSFTFSIWVSGSGVFRLKNTHGAVVDNFSSDITATAVLTRYDFSVTNNSSAGNGQQIVGIVPSTSFDAFDLIIYGAQLEQGSFATSYIPTSGATATRSADIADIATANFGYNPKAGTVVVDFNLINTPFTNFSRVFEFGNSGGSSSIGLLGTKNTNNLYGSINYSGAEQLSYNDVFKAVSEGTSKVSVSYTENDYAINIDGSQLAGDTSVLIPTGLATLYLGKDRSGTGNQINGHIKSIKYLPRRNSNTQLQEFTS